MFERHDAYVCMYVCLCSHISPVVMLQSGSGSPQGPPVALSNSATFPRPSASDTDVHGTLWLQLLQPPCGLMREHVLTAVSI